MEKAKRITIVEVGPRDGLQTEKGIISTEDKLTLIELLSEAGCTRIEATAFVSPKWVPQMADHDEVMRRARRRSGRTLSALVPNEKGAIAAIEAGAQELAVFASASETFAQKNTNCSISESIERFRPVMDLARDHQLVVRGYVSCAVDCPYEGAINPDAVRSVSARLIELGCFEIAVSDTLGSATPAKVDRMLTSVAKSIPMRQIACHFHDTSGLALENIEIALQSGVSVFDSSVGGLGGCPYAPGAAGNVATESVIDYLEGHGYDHGIDRELYSRAVCFARNLVVTGQSH